MEYNTSDLARILGKSERTIARWLQEGKGGLSRLENGKIEVSEETLLGLRPQDTETLILEKLASIEARLARIEHVLEERSAPRAIKQVAPPRPAPGQPELPGLVPRPALDLQVPADLPPGLEIATVFAQLHYPTWSREQITRLVQTLRETPIEEKRVPMVEGEYKLGKAKAKWALDAEGRARFYQVNHDRPGFELRECCPHLT